MDAVSTDDRRIFAEGTSEADWLGWGGLSALPATSAAALVPNGSRAVVVAPHPDDEVLMVGGLLAQLARAGTPILLIAVTDGTASHPDSNEWPVERLARERPGETRTALRRLGVETETVRLGLPDGGLQHLRSLLADRLLDRLVRSDVVFTTWRQDGHPDHEATGHACAFATARSGARLFEVPVWAWHWAAPGDARLPWRRARRVPLDARTVGLKRFAAQAFASQLHPDASIGKGPILRASTVERTGRHFELLFG